jgi:hypothetical protein
MGKGVMVMKLSECNENGTPIRYISGGRELRQYQGYWYVILTKDELNAWPGIHWNGYVLFHKWKIWKVYGLWYGVEEAIYRYLDGNRDNIRLSNIGVLNRQTKEYI